MKPQESWHLNQNDNNSSIYSLMAAQRGPDNAAAGITLKHSLTERFRGIVFCEGECGGSWRKDLLGAQEMKILRTQLGVPASSMMRHYLEHARLAVRATIEHPIWGGHGEELVHLLKEATK